MTPREQEILEAITDYGPPEGLDVSYILSPAKLATFLAKHLAETEMTYDTRTLSQIERDQFLRDRRRYWASYDTAPKSEEKCQFHHSDGMCGMTEPHTHPTPPSEEKKCCEGTCKGHAVGRSFQEAAKEVLTSPTQEEKKFMGMDVIEDHSMEPDTFKLEHRVSPTPPDTKFVKVGADDFKDMEYEVNVQVELSPPDAWEEFVREAWDADNQDVLSELLRSKKKEWELEVHNFYFSMPSKEGEQLRRVRTTTLEEVERVVAEECEEVVGRTVLPEHQRPAQKVTYAILTCLKEMRTK